MSETVSQVLIIYLMLRALVRHAAATAVVQIRSKTQSAATVNKGLSQAVEGFRAMESVRGIEGQGSPRKLLSTPEVEDMKLYFDSHIAGGEVPTIGRCRVFVGK